MDQAESSNLLYSGSKGYVRMESMTHNGKTGAMLFYQNPDPRKLHAIDVEGLREMEEGIEVVEGMTGELDFLIMYGAYDPVHAGADITQFAADCDYAAINGHLHRGTALDIRMKKLWPRLRTVSVMCGDRYGGSVEWPLFSQWSVCDKSARLQFSEVHLGIIPGWNGVLNVMLKSNQRNAAYMGKTGNGVKADELAAIGLVQAVVDSPDPPDRRSMPPEQWPKEWAVHAKSCQSNLLDAALELATRSEEPVRIHDQFLATPQDLAREVSRRLDRTAYKSLRDSISEQLAALGAEPDKQGLKDLNRLINKQLASLGKPLSPESVAAVTAFISRWGNLSAEQLVSDYAVAGEHEEQLCAELMHTTNRRIGINAVLSKNPVERVAVFE